MQILQLDAYRKDSTDKVSMHQLSLISWHAFDINRHLRRVEQNNSGRRRGWWWWRGVVVVAGVRARPQIGVALLIQLGFCVCV